MKEMTYPDYAEFGEILAEHIIATPAEVHGLLSGLLAGGLPVDDQSWHVHLNDLFNDGYALPVALQRKIEKLVVVSEQLYRDNQFAFYPWVPSDNDPLDERSEALAQWVQNFLVGFALVCQELSKAPDDIQELINDFNQIAQLSLEFDSEDEVNEQAFFEVLEYVRVGAMACFNHYALRPSNPASKTLH
ncbi:hypothetical protein EV690_3157 [Celerinatantimonas diazotrophica]|uniref:YecA family protein n=2 Tax=Celerinatantimonas diazotrophica TaxID=412034 RepID=A0A4R1J8T1_9GAMM|nr:hypothetical protein EV690_3157 [Celerinatantimonas diazotrophica]CAG9295771.1 hypothetical protein CEDIAZO_00898 [Celerinatantimonas diazotrophica]